MSRPLPWVLAAIMAPFACVGAWFVHKHYVEGWHLLPPEHEWHIPLDKVK